MTIHSSSWAVLASDSHLIFLSSDSKEGIATPPFSPSSDSLAFFLLYLRVSTTLWGEGSWQAHFSEQFWIFLQIPFPYWSEEYFHLFRYSPSSDALSCWILIFWESVPISIPWFWSKLYFDRLFDFPLFPSAFPERVPLPTHTFFFEVPAFLPETCPNW